MLRRQSIARSVVVGAVDAHTVRIGDTRITGETIVINAGTRPRHVPIDGIDEVDWLDNARLLDLGALPQQLIIVGGGYISLEFAQAYRRLGSEVTVLQRSDRAHGHPPDGADLTVAGEGRDRRSGQDCRGC